MSKQVENREISDRGTYYASLGELYRVLSAGFTRPSSGLVRGVQSGELVRFLTETLAPMEHEPLNSALEELGSYARSVGDQDGEELRRALEVEYNRLFVGPDTVLVAPYEARFIPDACGATHLMSQVTVRVVRAYERANLALPVDFTDMPDHIAAELSFVASLAHQAATVSERSEVSEKLLAAFLDEHLSQWVQAFSEKVCEQTTSAFYRSMASLAFIVVSLS